MEVKPAPLKDKLIEFDVGDHCDGFCYKDVAAAVEWLKQKDTRSIDGYVYKNTPFDQLVVELRRNRERAFADVVSEVKDES